MAKKEDITRVYYNIKQPHKGGKSQYFRVSEERRNSLKGTRTTSPCRDKIIDEVNNLYHSGKLKLDEAYTRLREYFDNKRKGTSSYKAPVSGAKLEPNVEKWLKHMLTERKREKGSEKNLNYHAIYISNILGSLGKDAYNVKMEEIRKAISDQHSNIASCKKISFYVNSLFQFLGRTEKINSAWYGRHEIEFNYINEEDFLELIDSVHQFLQAPLRILFYTGIRLGELYGLQEKDYDSKKSLLRIDRQLCRETKTLRLPKANKKRITVAPSVIKKDLKYWFDSKEEKIKRDRLQHDFKALCRSKGRGELRIHDLRHSFAKYLLEEKNLSISQVAMLIGDRIDIAQKHYIGSAFDPDTVFELSKKIS